MKRFGLLFGLLALLSAELFAQERIAVFPFEDKENIFSTRIESLLFYRRFSNEFTNRSAGTFSVVPRQEVEELINTEVTFQLSDLSSKIKTAEYERVLNGTRILSGMIGRAGSRIMITISLYTFPELKQLPGGIDMYIANVDELFDKVPELVQGMWREIEANSPPPPPAEQKKIFKIGDRGPGGGVIFAISGIYYYECSGELGRAENKIRAGEIARSYRGGGFTNWGLPSEASLNMMYTNLKLSNLGGFSNDWYFSGGYSINFRNGERETKSRVQDGFARTNCRVRAVRRFEP